uniref:BTB domain-containing protein n=1 Tax=Panagrolaimus sp. PS1159 TaxID=55785 RepID=A0AC35G0V2_9BILA
MKDNCESWKRDRKLPKDSKMPNFSIVENDGDKPMKAENKWASSKTKSINGSTLSLHILAFENSVEIENGQNCENDAKKLKPKTIAETFKVNLKNLFEIPRQQQDDDRYSVPEISQFCATQQLLNPNQLTGIEKCAIITHQFKIPKDSSKSVCQETPKFFDLTENAIQWSIRVSPNGYRSERGVGLQVMYHGNRNVTARFDFEIGRKKEENANEIEFFVNKETTRFRFSPHDMTSLTFSNFLSYRAFSNPAYKLLPPEILTLRVKAVYFFDVDAANAPKPPLNGQNVVTLIVGNKEIENIPALPLKKCSKVFFEKLEDPTITHLHFGNLNPDYIDIILAYIFEKDTFYEFLKSHPNDKKLQEYAEKLQMDELMMLLTRCHVYASNE